MKYDRKDAKAHSRATMRGIWAAANTPFRVDGAVDEDGFRRNMDHWIHDLGIEGLFIAGKQGEFFSMSVDERKRLFDLSVHAADGRAQTIMSCSDQNMDVVIDLAKHAQACGADYIVVHAPVLNFFKAQDETLTRYYETIASKVDIGMALWSHPDSGYLMSPELCNRLADIETVVAIKYSVPREMYKKLTALAGDRILVSTASEAEWLDNVLELGWQLYLCSSPPYTMQTKVDRRMREYTELAFAGKAAEARAISASLQQVREAFRLSKPAEKPNAHQKYWQELLGQVGGPVRAPLLELTEDEKRATREAFKTCGLKLA
ncbi:dihydrodipicolinate synthase family protein [Rhizobium sp. CECT 9324]|uniref:dihydrodipicolinate synthase family protein n=1 Tax=Rhizobium sp. CECT 9324 TaxID=2845820 RepID=UPI001E572424|nr:dihydrodipicolinate synthase family protein [Rhizobium sp. CECT 9324]CAH0342419.1 4-hydroxy-tetrahydrodipicolinate synthase [Rhizobium sp. CECT 9324]